MKEISADSSEIAAKETELAEAAKVRDAQNKDFQDNEHELFLTIDARSLVAAKKEFPSDEGLPRGAEAEQRGACLGPVQADRGHHDLP